MGEELQFAEHEGAGGGGEGVDVGGGEVFGRDGWEDYPDQAAVSVSTTTPTSIAQKGKSGT